MERYRRASERVSGLEELKREKQNKGHILESFILNLESCKKVLDEFDERLWMVTVDKVTVIPDGKLVFSFKDGTEIEV